MVAEERVRFLRLRQTIGALLIVSIVYLSLTPHPVALPGEHGDKYGHALAYATLMFWYALIYVRWRERIGWQQALSAWVSGSNFCSHSWSIGASSLRVWRPIHWGWVLPPWRRA
jgi:hypothetical protein